MFADGIGTITLDKTANEECFFGVSFDINTKNCPLCGYAKVAKNSNILTVYCYQYNSFGSHIVFNGNSYCTITGLYH